MKAAKSRLPKTEAFASVWDAIADSREQAANLRTRAELMLQLTTIVKRSGWTQSEAALLCGVSQPRMNDLNASARRVA
jgi:predicted XRE-type DNA-binding protein